MKHTKRLGILCCTLLVLTFLTYNCAAIFKGTSESVAFSTDPSGAKVFVNGQYMGTTPCQIPLPSKGTYTIEFKKEGYDPSTYTIMNHVGAGWVVLDVLFTGLIGVVVDAATGAWYELDTRVVNAMLEKQRGG